MGTEWRMRAIRATAASDGEPAAQVGRFAASAAALPRHRRRGDVDRRKGAGDQGARSGHRQRQDAHQRDAGHHDGDAVARSLRSESHPGTIQHHFFKIQISLIFFFFKF